jgi:hypothetical protein
LTRDAFAVLNATIEAALRGGRGVGDLPGLLTTVVRDQERPIRLLARRDSARPERHALYVYRSPALTVTLQAWDPGKWTPWHDHGCDALALAVVAGRVREEWFDGEGVRREARTEGDIVSADPAAPHRVGGGDGITLHAYTPELTGMTLYRATPVGDLWLDRGLPVPDSVRSAPSRPTSTFRRTPKWN